MQRSKRPNVLFILADQHNAKVLGHKGHPNVKTPNLDRLAESGVRFDNAITQNPICTPSRVSWLSGQYCHNHGYYGLEGGNPGGLPTVLGYARSKGYTTAAIGKIHCPEYWVEDDCDLFLESAGCSIGGRPEYDAYLKEKGLYDIEDHEALTEFGEKGRQTCDARPSRLSYEDSQEGWIVKEAIKFMKQAKEEEKPFIAHVSFPKPHQCYAPSEPFWSMYNEDELILPPNTDYDMNGKAPHMIASTKRWQGGDWTLFEPKTYEAGRLRKLHGYLGCISQVDHSVGDLVDWLKENGLAEDTIIIYSADHGDYACEHGIMEKAPGLSSDAITRIPYIWSWPGQFKAEHVVEEVVETVDMVPTLCSLLNIDQLETTDGKDISKLLHGGTGEVHPIGVTENVWSKSVRKGNYRYIFYPRHMFAEDYPEGFGELYNLETDPWEMTNLYFDEAYQTIVQDMRNELFDWMVTTTRPRTIHMDNINSPNQQLEKRYGHCTAPDGKMKPEWCSEFGKINYL